MILANLPPEILDEIASYLPYTSLLALRWTSTPLYNFLFPAPKPHRWHLHTSYIPPAIIFAHARHFTDLSPAIPPDNEVLKREQNERKVERHDPAPADRRRCMFDLLVVETWPAFDPGAGVKGARNLWACSLCLKLRPLFAFSTAQVAGHHAKSPSDAVERLKLLRLQDAVSDVDGRRSVIAAETRFCIDCGVRNGKYQKGTLLRFLIDGGGEGVEKTMGTGIVCKRCGQFKVTGAETKAGLRRLCEACLLYRPI